MLFLNFIAERSKVLDFTSSSFVHLHSKVDFPNQALPHSSHGVIERICIDPVSEELIILWEDMQMKKYVYMACAFLLS
jgi:hypothetical protein